MTKQHFIRRSPEIGDVLFNDIQALKKQAITLKWILSLQSDTSKFNAGRPYIDADQNQVPLLDRQVTLRAALDHFNKLKGNALAKHQNPKANQILTCTSTPGIGKVRNFDCTKFFQCLTSFFFSVSYCNGNSKILESKW